MATIHRPQAPSTNKQTPLLHRLQLHPVAHRHMATMQAATRWSKAPAAKSDFIGSKAASAWLVNGVSFIWA
ncbi:hypothetical protein V6N12_028671 [Hibiscus sabdariffa]|uniref:Uncharacterized protein n=1 Tax=Hibiscus sabdariffa TaxID=183260 RepID=A0ABR2F6N3_9ROSI